MRTTREAGIRTRALIVLHAAGGKSTAHIAASAARCRQTHDQTP